MVSYTYDSGRRIIPSFASKKVVSSSTKHYHNKLYRTAKLPSSARNLLDYLVEKMSDLNEVENSPLRRASFIQFMKKNCSVSYSDHTVHKSFQKLRQAGLLIRVKMRGVYAINPMCFFRGPEKKRIALLQAMLSNIPTGSKYDMGDVRRSL